MYKSIRFKKIHDYLVLVYKPDLNADRVLENIRNGYLNLKGAFNFQTDDCLDDLKDDLREFSFVIGRRESGFYRLRNEVFLTTHVFYISENAEISSKLFCAINRISIFREIDRIVDTDVYISDHIIDKPGYIPYDIYLDLIDEFPNSYELSLYSHNRVSGLLKNYIEGLDRYQSHYESYIDKKANRKHNHYSNIFKLDVLNLDTFERAYSELLGMLKNPEAYCEADWQLRIYEIICIIYPKYVAVKREANIGSDGRHGKRPDFLAVDSMGFVDVIEIKKPNKQRVITNTTYRDNYVADRDLSGAIVQIEKYIYTLNKGGTALEKKLTQMFSDDEGEINVKITNPQGILIMGRSSNLNKEQLYDLEIIRRQHKNIVDIMTYDDLEKRLKNTINHLKREEASLAKPSKTLD